VINTLIPCSQDVIRRLAAFARVWKHLNPVFAYCEFLGCIPGDVVASPGYNVRTYVNNNIQTRHDSAGRLLDPQDISSCIGLMFESQFPHYLLRGSIINGAYLLQVDSLPYYGRFLYIS
jgi:hypothetical protein